MLDDQSAASPQLLEPSDRRGADKIPDWDAVIACLCAVATTEFSDEQNGHSSSDWARLIWALVEQQRSTTIEGT